MLEAFFDISPLDSNNSPENIGSRFIRERVVDPIGPDPLSDTASN
jgi:hypothetical protein